MIRSHPRLAWLAAGLFGLAALFCVPLVLEAESLLSAEGDPVAIADRGLDRAFDRTLAIHEIEAALEADDADLAQSFVDLADDRGTALPPELRKRVKAAVDEANSASAAAGSFASGLITGEPKDMAGLAGTALGDLFVFGDIRDAVREGSRYVSGENYDQLILGLSVVGIAITASAYATVGAATPARLGLTAVKVARKTGRLSSAKHGDWGMAVRACFLALQAPEVLAVMEQVTGIRELSGDHTGYAGGISAMGRGDFLNPHIDNSGHPTYRGYRRLNALFYVSPNWHHDDGGHLELWSESMKQRLEVEARFNRLVVMNTNRQSLHSVNHVQSAERLRLCVSNYYYNPESPVGRAYSHITSFRGRPNERMKDLYLRVEGVLGSAYVRAFPRNVNKS